MGTPRADIREIEILLIDVGEQQIRETPEDESIGELAESIAAKGLLQPIGVTSKEDGRYQLRWGHRRLLAHQRLRRAKILARVIDAGEGSIKGLALVENLHRQQMSLRDEVEAVSHLIDQEGKSVEQVAAIVNKSRAWVMNRLMAPNLPEFLREPLLAGDLPFSHVEVISKVPDDGAQRYLAAQCIVQRWNRSQLATIAECYMTPVPQPEPAQGGTPGVNPNPTVAPFLYECQMCNEKDTLEKFTLVRIHKDGFGCRTEADRPDQASSPVNGMERHPGEHRGTDDKVTDRETETKLNGAR